MYAPLIYGNQWTKTDCKRVKLFDTWDWDCNTFHDTVSSTPSTSPILHANTPTPQYAQYNVPTLSVNDAAAAQTSQAEHGPAPPVADDPRADVHVTGQAQYVPPEGLTEEKVEYRDEDGNLLDEEEVRALEGKVSFSTRYETRTRLVDEFGNEVADGVDLDEHAGAKIEAVEPGTGTGTGKANTKPGKAGVDEDVRKEKSVRDAKATAEPEEEVGKMTREEL